MRLLPFATAFLVASWSLPSSAERGEWLTYYDSSQVALAVHTGRLTRSGSTVTGWFRMHFKAPRNDGYGDGNYQESDTKSEYDCASPRYRSFSFTNRTTDGAVVSSGKLTDKWFEIEPGTLAAIQRGYACDHPPFESWIEHSIAAEDGLRSHEDESKRGMVVTHIVPVSRKQGSVTRWERWANDTRHLNEYDCKGRRYRVLYAGAERVGSPAWSASAPGTIIDAVIDDACGVPNTPKRTPATAERAPVAPRAERAKFSAVVSIQVDGQDEIPSVTTLGESLTPLVLPPSIWQCFTRATGVETNTIPGLSQPITMFSKELVCSIVNPETQERLTQIGTAVACISGLDQSKDSFLYLRERERLIRLTLRCSFE